MSLAEGLSLNKEAASWNEDVSELTTGLEGVRDALDAMSTMNTAWKTITAQYLSEEE